MSSPANSSAPPLPFRPSFLQPSFSYCSPQPEAADLSAPYNRKKMSLDSCTPVKRLHMRSPSVNPVTSFFHDDDDTYVCQQSDSFSSASRDIAEEEDTISFGANSSEVQQQPTAFKSADCDVFLYPNEIQCETVEKVICCIRENADNRQMFSKIIKIQIIHNRTNTADFTTIKNNTNNNAINNTNNDAINCVNGNDINSFADSNAKSCLKINENREECCLSDICFSYINAQAVQFTTPFCEEAREMELYITVLLDESRTQMLRKKICFVRTKVDELSDDLSHIYIQMITQLLQLIFDNNLDKRKVDKILCSVIEDDYSDEKPRFSILAFENLFRVGKSRNKCDVLYPSLLHVSSKFCLKNLTEILIDLPDSNDALQRKNCLGQTAADFCPDVDFVELLDHARNHEDAHRSSCEVNEYLPMDLNNRNTCPIFAWKMKSQRAPVGRPADSTHPPTTSNCTNPISQKNTYSSSDTQNLSLTNSFSSQKLTSSLSNLIPSSLSGRKTPVPLPKNLTGSTGDERTASAPQKYPNSLEDHKTGANPVPEICNMSEEEMFKMGATCKSQMELLSILDQAKKKNISLMEADLLFKQWKLKEDNSNEKNEKKILGDFGGVGAANDIPKSKFKQNSYSNRSVDRKKTKMSKHFSSWLNNGRSNSVIDTRASSASTPTLNNSTIDLTNHAQTIESNEEDDVPTVPPVPPRPPFLNQSKKK